MFITAHITLELKSDRTQE